MKSLSNIDFSKNYNKQHHEIQSAYLGYEAFTLYTPACYYRSHDIDEACVDKNSFEGAFCCYYF